MKNLRQLCAAAVLTLALSLSAFADGNMHTTIADPPPPSSDGQITTWVAGQMPTTSNVASPVDPMTQMALTLWQSVLSLF